MLGKTQWPDPFNFYSGIYTYIKNTFQLLGFQFGGSYWHFFPAKNGHVLSTQTYGQSPAGALTICLFLALNNVKIAPSNTQLFDVLNCC